jgi:hypothetical protein
MQARFDERLASPYAGPVIVILAPALHAKMTFDAIAQEHAWGLADAAGRWIGITLPHDEAQAMIAARLQRISELGDVRLVLAEVHVARSRFALRPIAVVARMPSVGKAGLLNLDLETGGTELPSAAMRADWLSLLARKPEGAPPVLAQLVPAADRGVTSRLLAECAEALLATAELGTLCSGPEQRARLAGRAQQLEDAGLLPPADAMACVADAGPGDSAAALLRASYILDRTRTFVRQLAWLDRVG